MNTQPQRTHPLRIGLTFLHLLVLGFVGNFVLAALFGILSAGIVSLFAFGLGLLILVPLVYVFFGVAWLETERVIGLYRLDLPSLSLRRMREPGFGGYLRSLGRQSVDGRMWRALANFTIGVAFGTIIYGIGRALVSLFPLGWGDVIPPSLLPARLTWLVVALLVVLGLAAVVGLTLLFRIISIGVIGAGVREALLREQVKVTSHQREGAVRAADVERTRIERDLHDGIQPRLVSVGMTLGLASQTIDTDPAAAKALIDEAHTSTKAAITELRQLARGIHASVLDDRGLDAALSALAGRSHIPVHLDVQLDTRCSRQAEAAIYFMIAEALTNAAKHSRASECRVTVRQRDGGLLWARVEDNGIGSARIVPGGGLDGVHNRALGAGGTMTLSSPAGGPTTLEVTIPCES